MDNNKRLEDQMMSENYCKDLTGCLKTLAIVGFVLAAIIVAVLLFT